MTKPITPKQVADRKRDTLPDEVIEAFNELIAEAWDSHSAVVRQKDAVARIAMKLGIEMDAVYNQRYLDVEDVFRKAGWCVEYDKPGFNESYEATFEFTKRKR